MKGTVELTHPAQHHSQSGPLPKILAPGHDADRGGLLALISGHRDALKSELQQAGGLLFRGWGLKGAHDFEAALDAAQFKEMPYVGGAAPRSAVTGGRIMTANESPAHEKIPLHHEMAQTPNPPDYIFFYCNHAPGAGGATTLLDSRLAFETLLRIDPKLVERLDKEGVRYTRVMPYETDAGSPIGRSWRETFNVDSRSEAEIAMRNAKMSWEWLEGQNLKTQSSSTAAIGWDRQRQRRTFFNSVIAAFTGWYDSRNDGAKAVHFGGGDPLSQTSIDTFLEATQNLQVNMPWEAGDMLWLDNRLILHARQPYEGDREVFAAIAQD